MPAAYPPELRHLVLEACAAGELKKPQIVRAFKISLATLYDWLKTEREEERREAKPHNGGPARTLSPADEKVLEQLAQEQNDCTLAEYCVLLQERTGKRISDTTMSSTLARLKLTRKKNAARQRAGPAGDPGRVRGVPEGSARHPHRGPDFPG